MLPSLDEALAALETEVFGLRLYKAGVPRYERIFPRDLFYSCFLMQDTEMNDLARGLLRNTLEFCVRGQGRRSDAETGEEFGKIPHEFPGVLMRGLLTTYNGVDETLLFLMGFRKFLDLTQDEDFVESQVDSLRRALGYALKHLKEGRFVESPKFAGAERFALSATYWKDSALWWRAKGDPVYPVVYSLVQAQAARALNDSSHLAERFGNLGVSASELRSTVEDMLNILWGDLWDEGLGCFVVAEDDKGPMRDVVSDSLDALYWLKEPHMLRQDQATEIVESSQKLASPYGYKTARFRWEPHHYGKIWFFENAQLARAGRVHHLQEIFRSAMQVRESVLLADDFYEFFNLSGDSEKIHFGGCRTQLWTIAAVASLTEMSK